MPIKPANIAKYYITTEINKALSKPASRSNFVSFINLIHKEDMWRLAHLISSQYRNNSIYETLKNQNLFWTLETIKIEDILLTDVNDEVKPFLQLSQYKPIKLKGILDAKSDESLKKVFKNKPVDPEESIFIFIRTDNNYKIIDGIHRLMSLVQQGTTSVRGYIGKGNSI